MSLTDQSQREIEAAWERHEPERALISRAVRRQLRQIKASLAPTAACIEDMLRHQDQARTLFTPIIARRGVARQRLLAELRRCFPAATVSIAHKSILEIAWLSPKSAIIVGGQDGEQQDCILACYACAYPPIPNTLTIHSTWALELADHCCARFLQRAPNADLREAALSAARSFVGANALTVRPLIGSANSIYLPAGAAGVFAGNVIGGLTTTGTDRIYARCKTFVPASWLKPDQTVLPEAPTPESTVALALWKWGVGCL